MNGLNLDIALRRYRTERGLSQVQVAVRAGVFRNLISDYERGKRTPNLRTLHDLCVHGFGIKLSEFFAWVERQPVPLRCGIQNEGNSLLPRGRKAS